MANIAALLKRIESGTLSYEEKLSALSQVEQSLQDMRQKKQEAIQSNVMLIVDALKQMQVKVEQQLEEAKAIVPQKGQKGDKGEKGERGLDGAPGKDGRNGIDGKDGKDGNDGISVTDAKIDFDGSLVITLSNGREINVGEVLPLEVSDKIKVIANSGGTSQTVVDTLTSLQNQINTLTGIDGVLGDMAQQNANSVAITGGAIDGATIGGVTPAAGTFTTLTATGQTSLGGVAGSESLRVLTPSVVGARLDIQSFAGSTQLSGEASTGVVDVVLNSRSSGSVRFRTAGGTEQARVSHTASAVNYVQATGGATGSGPIVSAQGSDTNVDLLFSTKGTAGSHVFRTNSTVRQFQVNHVTSAVNYGVVTGAIAGNAVPFTVAGSDTNISQVFQSKGTGAIDLAAGSSGVNISNGGTVTALTVTGGGGGGYTTLPSVAITAPTTAGGVQATASINANLASPNPTIVSGGTGYTVGDVLTIVGGTFSAVGQLTVSTVSAGVITAVTISAYGTYTVLPTNPVSVTGGSGSGATFNLNWGVRSLNITNAGSGYVEQPTVSFSGGGGSGAAAYATVGSGTVVKCLGTVTDLYTPAGIALRLESSSFFGSAYWRAQGSAVTPGLFASGPNGIIGTGSSGVLQFTPGNTEQFRVSTTASAVNYVQVTGAATGGATVISSQGSDSSVNLGLATKGAGVMRFFTGGTVEQFRLLHTASAVNYATVTGAAAGSAPAFSVAGSDTNIDLTLTTKGTGAVKVNTGTGEMVRIADSAGTGFVQLGGGTNPYIVSQGSTNASFSLASNGTGTVWLRTNGGGTTQAAVAHTASAVNYVQVTGAATTARPTISAEGSDTNINLVVASKGTGSISLRTSGSTTQFSVTHNASAVNYWQATGAAAGASPVFSVQGSDTNIDLTLTPKGTGNVRFGTYTGTALTIAGYIEIKDSGGTVRKLAVVA